MEIMCNVIIGLITGLISGWLVYVLTKRRETKFQVYQFWKNYLFKAFEHCEMYTPIELLNYMSSVGDKDSEWYKAILKIIDDTRPFALEDRELTEKEIRISENIIIAIKELDVWARKNHLRSKQKK